MSTTNTLIQAIKNAILTGTGGDVSIQERSFLSHLLENKRGGFFFSEKKEKQQEQQSSFVVTRWISCMGKKIMMGIMWVIHVLWYLIVSDNRSRRVRDIWSASWGWLKNVATTKGWKNRKARAKDIDRGKVRKLLNVRSSPAINMAVIALVCVLGICLIVYVSIFAIKDVMFPQLNMKANESGVITIEQPYLESHSFFLLNASTYWHSTGINVIKGDRVSFSVSGSMYSDIGDMSNAARDDRKPKYDRSCFNTIKDPKSTEGVEYCLYNKEDALFGTLLCKVAEEHLLPQDTSGSTIIQITNENTGFAVNDTGVLCLTFNDILLTQEMVNRMLLDSSGAARKMQEDLLGSKFFTYITPDGSRNESYKDRIKQIVDEINNGDSAKIITLRNTIRNFYNIAHPDSTIWFKDNLGEYLVNIRVERNIWKSDLNFIKKCFFSILREFNHCLLRIGYCKTFFWILVFILLCIFIDIVVSCMVSRRNKKNGSVNKESHGNEQPSTKDKHQKKTSSPQRKTKAAGKKRQKPKEAGGK